MDANPYAALALDGEPEWPDDEGPALFLLEVSGPLEERLLEGWITRHSRRADALAHTRRARLPQTRRRRQRRNTDPRLEAFLSGDDDDPLLVPLRVVWLAPSRGGERKVRWHDLLRFVDPRDPDSIRQHLIFRTHPDRCRIVMGAPLRLSAMKEAWLHPDERGRADGYSLSEFTAARAWLALERAERALRGNQYKVPKFPRESIVATRAFARGVAELAKDAGTTYNQMAVRTRRYVDEVAATHSPYVIDLVAGAIEWIFNKAYVDLKYDKGELAALYEMSQRFPLVFLPSHKSNFDHLVLLYILYRNGLPPNHTAGGINMNFFPVGPFLRRSGLFFIRREFKDNDPYKYVLRRYVDYLLEKRFPLEWYIEGGRSRSGKLRPPRLGLLAYVVESFERGAADDVIFMPVSIAYDQIQEVGSYALEQSGGRKQRESLGWLYRTLRGLRRRYGAAHLRFGAPISLRGFLATQDTPHVEADDAHNPAIPKLAFEVAARINEVTPITPISLVTLALLTAGERALTVDEVQRALEPFASYIAERDLPVTEKLAADDRDRIVAALGALSDHGVVTRFEGATDVVYRIEPKQHLSAAYYRNTIIHFFINGAITELALQKAAATQGPVRPEDVTAAALHIRDLLKFEFFFSGREDFIDQIHAELDYRDRSWKDRVVAGEARLVLSAFHPFQSPPILRPFFDAYAVVGEVVKAHASDPRLDRDELAAEALALGKQWLLQGRLQSPESVSSVLFASAFNLAENRGLFSQEAEVADRRIEFAQELQQVDGSLSLLETLETAHAAGVID